MNDDPNAHVPDAMRHIESLEQLEAANVRKGDV